LRVLAADAEASYGEGAVLRLRKMAQRAGIKEALALALAAVCAHVFDGRALGTLSLSPDAITHLRNFGVDDTDTCAAVLEHTQALFAFPYDVDFVTLICNPGLRGADEGKEAMRLLVQFLELRAPGVIELQLDGCGIGDAGAFELAQGLHKLPRLKIAPMFSNRFSARKRQMLRRAWHKAGKPGMRVLPSRPFVRVGRSNRDTITPDTTPTYVTA
jgi:hypothetical protein